MIKASQRTASCSTKSGNSYLRHAASAAMLRRAERCTIHRLPAQAKTMCLMSRAPPIATQGGAHCSGVTCLLPRERRTPWGSRQPALGRLDHLPQIGARLELLQKAPCLIYCHDVCPSLFMMAVTPSALTRFFDTSTPSTSSQPLSQKTATAPLESQLVIDRARTPSALLIRNLVRAIRTRMRTARELPTWSTCW